ncbi:hypothetical protein CANINC_004688 [Pichia inconspicua]|uniref:Thioredoxin domain-containing protein n=1 Tax=Pichia inconspicua TaxID=52247 RepID=A0A4T0WVY9_9ASCO|nr:hypothetical protein CANINC_004688 [[Candida] inconspicua]
MTIVQGESVPTKPAFLYLPPPIDGACSYAPVEVAIDSTKKPVLIVIVPGAFTPTCSERHIPGYLTASAIESLKSSGIAEVFIVSVDSPFITRAWGESLTSDADVSVKEAIEKGYVKFVSDAGAEWLQSVGLVGEPEDKFAKNGLRGLRTAVVVDKDNVATYIGIDDKRGVVEKSGIDGVLEALRSKL